MCGRGWPPRAGVRWRAPRGDKTREVGARLASDGGDPMPSSPEEYSADIAREDAKWGTLIRKLGLKVE